MIDFSISDLRTISDKLSKKFDKTIDTYAFDFYGVYSIVAFVDNKKLDGFNDIGHYYERVLEISTKFFIKVRFFDDDIKEVEKVFLSLLDIILDYCDDDIYKELEQSIKEYEEITK